MTEYWKDGLHFAWSHGSTITSDCHSAMALTFNGSDGSLDLDRLDTSTVSPNTKWQIHAVGLLAREVTDTIFGLNYCNLHYTT